LRKTRKESIRERGKRRVLVLHMKTAKPGQAGISEPAHALASAFHLPPYRVLYLLALNLLLGQFPDR